MFFFGVAGISVVDEGRDCSETVENDSCRQTVGGHQSLVDCIESVIKIKVSEWTDMDYQQHGNYEENA